MNSQLNTAIAQSRYQDMVRTADSARLASQLPRRSFPVSIGRTFAGLRIALARTSAQPS